MSGPQVHCRVLDRSSPEIDAAGEALARAVLASLKRPPRCACGAVPTSVKTTVELVGPTLAIDLVLRCERCERCAAAYASRQNRPADLDDK